MAVCRSCLEEIYEGATRCPHCHTVQMGSARRALNFVGTLLIGLILLAIVLAFLSKS